MKEALTRTNFVLGEASPRFEYSMRLPAPGSDLSQYTGLLNADVQRFIKKSSVHFGDDPQHLKTSAHLAMEASS
eukprot:6467882-Prorocentrum_lima.AAC.1